MFVNIPIREDLSTQDGEEEVETTDQFKDVLGMLISYRNNHELIPLCLKSM